MNIERLTDERGENYGHPYDHFRCTQMMYNIWTNRQESNGEFIGPELDWCLRHIVYMIVDKLARAAENPMVMDNFDDIQGYASLWRKCVRRHEEVNDG